MSVFAELAAKYLELDLKSIKGVRKIEQKDIMGLDWESFEKHHKTTFDKIWCFVHCNMGGSYLYNFFEKNGYIYYFDSDNDYWETQTDTYNLEPNKTLEYSWFITRRDSTVEKKREFPLDLLNPVTIKPSVLRK
jgi:nitrate reductase alpha subunit